MPSKDNIRQLSNLIKQQISQKMMHIYSKSPKCHCADHCVVNTRLRPDPLLNLISNIVNRISNNKQH